MPTVRHRLVDSEATASQLAQTLTMYPILKPTTTRAWLARLSPGTTPRGVHSSERLSCTPLVSTQTPYGREGTSAPMRLLLLQMRIWMAMALVPQAKSVSPVVAPIPLRSGMMMACAYGLTTD